MMQLCRRPIQEPQEISNRQMSVVIKAISMAWKILTAGRYRPSESAPVFSKFEDENAVTDQLVMILNTLADDGKIILGFDNSTFQTIEPGSRQPNSDGNDFGNQPDFIIRPQARPTGVPSMQYGVYVECKTIDNNRGPNLYITKGVSRFVEGRYGWSMKHGLMLGYVLNQQKLPADLDTAFKRLKKPEHLQLKPVSTKTKKGNIDQFDIHETLHNRPKYPPHIRLEHIWLTYSN